MHFHPRLAMPLAAALLLGLTPLAASAKTLHISGNFVTENSATTTPTGNITGTLDTTTGVLDYTVTYGGLTGPVLAAHFHGPAAPGQEAPVMLPIPGPYKSGMHGQLNANSATEKALLAGMTYVNLHTEKYPMGEARAQVKVSS
jgi:hypothetical protein